MKHFLAFPELRTYIALHSGSEAGLYNCIRNQILTHYQTTNFRLFHTKRVCRRQFKFDENGRKLSKRVENTKGKGEIARYEQFLLFS